MVVGGFGMVIQNFPLCFTLYSVPCTVALVSESAAPRPNTISNRSHFVAQTPAGAAPAGGLDPMARGGCSCWDHREVLAVRYN